MHAWTQKCLGNANCKTSNKTENGLKGGHLNRRTQMSKNHSSPG